MTRSNSLLIIALLIVLFAIFVTTDQSIAGPDEAQNSNVHLPVVRNSCWPDNLPTGAIPGQPLPVFCDIDNQGPDTSQEGDNSWIDEFNHHLEFADFSGTRYEVFDTVGFIYKTIHWRHMDHWMVDLASRSATDPPRWVRGGALMRPAKTFQFEDGRLVVEADVAASIAGYDANAWPELVISTGERPHDVGSLYAYDLFPEDWTLGCRLQASRYPVCALKSNSGDIQAGKGSQQIWEMSAHQPVGTDNFGGFPNTSNENYWRECVQTDPDTYCRDRFRLELTQTSLTLFVNGYKYFEQRNIPPLPGELFTGDLSIYFASMVVSHPAKALRFHWDRLSINPSSPPSPAPEFESTEPDPYKDECMSKRK